MQIADTTRSAGPAPAQKVVIVNGTPTVLGMLEDVLDEGRYDMVFVESSERAYTRIRKVVPHLVILCGRIEEVEVFQLLTMLKLDPETRDIPVVSFTTESEDTDGDVACACAYDDDTLQSIPPALSMN